MLVGLFGSGKTTTAGKLAKYFSTRGKKVALVGLDVWRPAAMDQLEQVGKQADVQVFINKKEKDPIKIYNEFAEKYKNYDLLIVDTAGRDALNDELIKEVELITKTVQPDETLLVISGDIGQAAQSQAETFHKACGVTGVIATKMDGTAKGGGALSACAVTQAPIKFMGVGEKIDDLEKFNPKGFVGRLLGTGDIEALLDKAKEAMTENEATDMTTKFLTGDYNLEDLYNQMTAMRKMGPLGKIMEMIPGMGQLQLPKEMLDVQVDKLKRWKFIIDSCSKEEKKDPDAINAARIDRISKGSGTSTNDVRDLLKQYKQSKKMAKMFKGGSPEKMMKKMQQKMKGMPMKF